MPRARTPAKARSGAVRTMRGVIQVAPDPVDSAPKAGILRGSGRGQLVHADAEILIVDDEPSVVRFFRALQSAGYKPPRGSPIRSRPLPTLTHMTRISSPFDMCMPGLDGYGLLDALARKRSPDTFLPVLAISALDDFAAREKAIKAGAKDFLVKPMAVDEFLLHVYSLLTRASWSGGSKKTAMSLRVWCGIARPSWGRRTSRSSNAWAGWRSCATTPPGSTPTGWHA